MQKFFVSKIRILLFKLYEFSSSVKMQKPFQHSKNVEKSILRKTDIEYTKVLDIFLSVCVCVKNLNAIYFVKYILFS